MHEGEGRNPKRGPTKPPEGRRIDVSAPGDMISKVEYSEVGPVVVNIGHEGAVSASEDDEDDPRSQLGTLRWMLDEQSITGEYCTQSVEIIMGMLQNSKERLGWTSTEPPMAS